jgi:type I phosphodiesterase/nucleotide pyrophosphatase
MSPNTDERVNELRQQLRALGYLDAGVDRFLLAPAGRTRGAIALALQSSVRVGLLGGVLLGPAAAIGVGGRLPGLVTGVGDAVVIALYLAAVFFIALAAISFFLSVATPLLVRGRSSVVARRFTGALGWIIAIGCLAYLTFWWQNANAGFGWSAVVWTLFALAIAVTISLLVGYAIRITTLAAVVAADTRFDAPLPSRSWRALVFGGIVAFAGAAAVLVLTAEAETPPIQPALTVVGGQWRVRVIAVDGVDARIFATAGWIDPTRATGVSFTLAPQDTSDPARAWTTIATGEPPSVHGVRGLETRRVAGLSGAWSTQRSALARTIGAATDLVRLTRPSVASSNDRQSLTMWEVAEEAGLRSSVVNWWATWPAPSRAGIVVSDRAVLRLERGGTLDAEIAPADLYQLLRGAWPSIRSRAADAAQSAFASITDKATAATLRRSAELDMTVLGVADALPPPPRDLDVVYLPGLDIAQHALLAMAAEGAVSPSTAADRIAAVRTYYDFLGRALRPRLQPHDRDVVVIVTQPGRVQTPSAGTLTLLESIDGSVTDLRPGIRSAGTARVEEIVPTIVAILGLPLSRELPGDVLQGITATLSTTDRRYVATYGKPVATPLKREGKPLDQEMIDRLRSLGYVK